MTESAYRLPVRDPRSPALVVGPGLDPLVWYPTAAKAKVVYWTRQHMIFTHPDDLQRDECPLPRHTLRQLISALFGAEALKDPPYLDEVWEACRHTAPFYAPGSPLHDTTPAQWDAVPGRGPSGILDPSAPARILRYHAKLRRRGLYVDPQACATFQGPLQATLILKVLVANYGDGRVIDDDVIIRLVTGLAQNAHLIGSAFRTRQKPAIVYRYYRPRFLAHGALRVVGEPVITKGNQR